MLSIIVEAYHLWEEDVVCSSLIPAALINILTTSSLGKKGFIGLSIPGYSLLFQGSHQELRALHP